MTSVSELAEKVRLASARNPLCVTADHLVDPGGRRAVSRRVKWTVSGGCEAPVPIELYGRGGKSVTGKEERSLEVTLYTRCRKCVWCRRKRQHDWTGYAVQETAASSRTWLGTLTMSPDNHYRALAKARCIVPDFDDLTADRRFSVLAGLMGDHVTLWLKRIRANSRAPIRYLMVAEKHTDKLDGFPHYHILIHEQDEGAPVRQRILREAWRIGFSSFWLVNNPAQAIYPCKYLLKDASSRVRASFRYGRNVRNDIDEQEDASQMHSHPKVA